MKLFVWDFHGVLEKNTEIAVIQISNEVLERSGYAARFSDQDIVKLYGLKWYEYFKYLLPELSHEQHLELQQECFVYDEKNQRIIENVILPNDYSHEVLKKIALAGHTQVLISNTRQDHLDFFVRAVKIEDYFTQKN